MKNLIGLKNIRYELDRLKGVIPHICLSGPRGTGKTTVAKYVATSKKKKLIFVTGNTLKKQELLNILINIEEGDVLLIDEIHRLRPDVEEMLYQPMENFQISLKDMSGRFHLYDIPKFTVIGTTTKTYKISKPLMSRFQLALRISHYNVRELTKIILNEFSTLSVREALLISLNTVTPREAINLSRRAVSLDKNIKNALLFMGYKYGLSKSERFYLKIVYNVGKISLSSLTSALQLDIDEVKYIEDKLIQKGYIEISSKGRQLTVKGLIKVKEIKNGK